MRERELKLLPIGLSEQRQLELVKEFEAKDFRRKDEYILAYVRLSRYVAFREFYRHRQTASWDDIEAVGYASLAEIPYEIGEGRLSGKSVYKYTIARVRTRCRNFLRSDFLIHTPERSARRGKRVIVRDEGSEANNDSGIYPYTDPTLALMYSLEDTNHEKTLRRKELVNELLRHAQTSLEYTVLSLHFSGYTDKEIAWKLGSSESTVRKARNTYTERLKLKIKNNANFLALS